MAAPSTLSIWRPTGYSPELRSRRSASSAVIKPACELSATVKFTCRHVVVSACELKSTKAKHR